MIKSSGRPANEAQFLSENALIRNGAVFNLKVENDPISPGDYVYSAERNKFRNIQTGFEYSGTEFINGRNNIEVQLKPELESASQSRINSLLNKGTIAGVKSGIRTAAEFRKLTPQEIALFDSIPEYEKHRQGQVFNKLLNETNKVTTRRALGFDFESMVDASSRRINPSTVFSSGVTEALDVTYDPGDAMSAAGAKTRMRRETFRSTTYFDVDKVRDLLKAHINGETVENHAIFGKQNLALALEHLRQYTSGQATDSKKGFDSQRDLLVRQSVTATDSEIIGMQNNLREAPGIEKIEAAIKLKGSRKNVVLGTIIDKQLEAFSTRSGNGAENALSLLESISNKIEVNNLAYSKEAAEHSHGHGRSQWSTGIIEYLGKRPGTSKGVFTKDVILDTVEDLMNHSKSGRYDKFLIFGNAERDVLSQWGNALDIHLESMVARGEVDEVKKGRYLKAKEHLNGVMSRTVDVKALSEQVFDGFLPDIRRHLKDNANGVRNVAERMFGYENTHKIQNWGVERFLQESHSGFSLENLYSVFKDKNYQEWHTGAKDSADMGHFHMFLDDLVSKQGKSYRAETPHNMPGPGLVKLESNEFELFNISNRLARNIQSKTIVSEILRDKSREDIMGLLGKVRGNISDESRHLIDDKTMESFTKLNDHKFLSEVTSRLQSVINSEIKKSAGDVTSRTSMFKYKSPDPGLLNRAISTSSAGKFLALGAFMYFSSLTAAQDPGTSIETGEHNSLETVARRIATTPFNSAISLGSVGNFARDMLKRFSRKSISTIAEGALLTREVSTTFLNERVRTRMSSSALSVAASSAEKRLIASQSKELGYAASSLIPASRRAASSIEYRYYKKGREAIDTHLKLVNMRSSRHSTYKLDLSHPINDNVGRPRFQTKGFLLPTTGKYNAATVVGLSPPVAAKQEFLYGDPFAFMNRHKGLSMTDSLTNLYPAKNGLVTPSFSKYWDTTSKGFDIDVGKIDMGKQLSLSTRADMAKMKSFSNTHDLSSVVVSRKQSKDIANVVTIGAGNTTSTPVDSSLYAGVLQNYKPDNSTSFVSYNTLKKVARERPAAPITGLISPGQKVMDIPVTYNNSPVKLNASPIYHAKKDVVTPPVMRGGVQRSISSNYHLDAAKALQKPNRPYPASAAEAMESINAEAYRY